MIQALVYFFITACLWVLAVVVPGYAAMFTLLVSGFVAAGRGLYWWDRR